MKPKNKKSVYEKLSKTLSNEEIAESYVFATELNSNEKTEHDKEFKTLRLRRLSEMTEKEYFQAGVIRLRFQIEEYLHSNEYIETKSFGYFLSEYIHLIRRSNSEFSKDISLHASTLSRLLNNKEVPNKKILIRLELHSNNIIPASLWYRLTERQREFDLLNDKKTRTEEKRKVKQML